MLPHIKFCLGLVIFQVIVFQLGLVPIFGQNCVIEIGIIANFYDRNILDKVA